VAPNSKAVRERVFGEIMMPNDRLEDCWMSGKQTNRSINHTVRERALYTLGSTGYCTSGDLRCAPQQSRGQRKSQGRHDSYRLVRLAMIDEREARHKPKSCCYLPSQVRTQGRFASMAGCKRLGGVGVSIASAWCNNDKRKTPRFPRPLSSSRECM
jgi:hypothetical protein